MKNIFFIALLIFAVFACTQKKEISEQIPLAPEQYRKPENYKPESYGYTLNELKDQFSEGMMKRSAEAYQKVVSVNEKGKWKGTPESIDEHKAPEWFLDAKFGMFIDWGLWSIAGWAPKIEEGAMYPDWYEFRLHTDSTFMAYHHKNWGADFRRDDFIPLFQAKNYNPEMLVDLAEESGMKYVVPFCKHHSGFCLWPSSYTKRNSFEMGPNRDLIRPIVEKCKEEGLKFGFYFSVDEWEYPIIGSDGDIKPRIWSTDVVPTMEQLEHRASGKIAVNDFTKDYLVPQAVEFIDNYDPDLIWYDGEWLTEATELQTYDISAYYYNQAEGRKEVAVNDRYGTKDGKRLRSIHGDFYTSEYDRMGNINKKLSHPWEECRGISQSFGYNWQDTEENVISSKDFVDMFVDIVAKGGNLLLIVNLDGQGALPKIQQDRLIDIGKWLEINGEGIYSTRACYPYLEEDIAFTKSKDGKNIYVIMKEWPGSEVQLQSILFDKVSKVEMLGYEGLFTFQKAGEGVLVELPRNLQAEANRPSNYASILKVTLKAD